MKFTFASIAALLIFAYSCSKEDNTSSGNGSTTSTTSCDFFPYVVGSKYITKKTQTSSGAVSYDTLIPDKDTTIDGTKFLKCSLGGQPLFLSCNYKGYYTQISDFTILGQTCNLVSKEIKLGGSVGAQWVDSSTSSSGSSISIARDMEIKEVNISVTSNGINYSDVTKIEAQTYTYIGGFISGVVISNYYFSKVSGLIKVERYDNASTVVSQLREFYKKI